MAWCYDATGTKCSGRAQPGAVALMAFVLRVFGGRNLGIYNCRPVRGGGSLSTHGEGRGDDIGLLVSRPAEKAIGDRLVAWFVSNAESLGVQRVIWNRRQWDSRNRAWRPYNGDSPHTDHVHVELCWAAARTLTMQRIEEIYRSGQEAKDMGSFTADEVIDLTAKGSQKGANDRRISWNPNGPPGQAINNADADDVAGETWNNAARAREAAEAALATAQTALSTVGEVLEIVKRLESGGG